MLHGISINQSAGIIDYSLLKTSPFQYMFIRGAVAKNQDGALDYNSRESRKIGMPYGLYYEIRPQNAWKAQADYHAEIELEFGGNMPPVLFLDNDGELKKFDLDGWVSRWIKQFEQTTNKSVIVMTNAPFCNKQWPLTDFLWHKHLWLNDPVPPQDVPLEWANHKKGWTFLTNGACYPVNQYGISEVLKVPSLLFVGGVAEFEKYFRVKPRQISPTQEKWLVAKTITTASSRLGPGTEFPDSGTILQDMVFKVNGNEVNGFLPLEFWISKSLLTKG